MAVLGLRTTHPAGAQARLTPTELVGVFSADWMDPDPASGLEPIVRYFLRTADSSHELLVGSDVLDAAGGATRVQGRRVKVHGSMSAGGGTPFHVHGLELLELRAGSAGEDTNAITAGANAKWLTILCKYADFPAEPTTFDYFQMYANARPGLDHYWREVSYGAHAVAGSHTVGWFVLPKTKAQYPFDEYMADCRALADPIVYFPDYDGITVILNGPMGDGSFNGGGGSVVLTLDGTTKSYGSTVLSSAATIGTAAHEMGHAYGLGHTSGDYTSTYDNLWDNMSTSRAQHINAYQKDQLGWIPGRRLDVAAGSSVTVSLDTLAQPSLAWHMIKIPVSGTHRYYTVESRPRIGLDDVLPGDAVVIHDVDLTRHYYLRRARIVDGDLNGNAMDDGAMWVPGESFVDTAFGITITVNSQTAGGFNVTVTYPPPSGPLPTILANPLPARTLIYGTSTFSVSAQDATSYDWEISTNNGTSWSPIPDADDWKFSGKFSPTLTNSSSWEDGALFRVVVSNPVGSVTSAAASLRVGDLLLNGRFDAGFANWFGYATPSSDYLSAAVVNGVLEFFRVPPPPGQPNQAVVLQSTGVPVPFGPAIYQYSLNLYFSAGNSSNVRKRLSVLVHDGDFSDLSVCTFWLAPQTPLTFMNMTTHATKAWSNATVSFYAATPGSDGGAYLLDNVVFYGLTPGIGGVVTDTLCNGVAAAPTSGSPGPELLVNGDFAGGLSSWSTWGQIVAQVTGGVVEFYRPAGNPAGVILQSTGAAVAPGAVITSTFDLGNSSSVRKRVTVLLHDSDFSDLTACTFWIPPSQPLMTYKLRTRPTQPWSNATMSIYAATVGNEAWILLDNASLRLTPNAAGVTTTLCLEPGSSR